MVSYREWKDILRDERLPAVVVDVEAFDRNVARLAGFLEGKSMALRLATKSVRVPELIKRVLAYGAPYKGLMCFSAEEAFVLATHGLDDFLIAYPTFQKSDLELLRDLHEKGKTVALVVDSGQGLVRVAEQMRGVAKPFRVVVDVDVSLRLFGGLVHFGVRRSPVRSARDVARLLDEAARHPELKAVGAMAYEAQVAGLGDRNPFKRLINPIARLIRQASVSSVAEIREEVAQLFTDRGVALEIMNGGGTGSINYAASETVLTELSAGSGLLCSHLFDYYSNVHFEPACFFALQVVRSSDNGYVTCQGGGYVASGEPGWDRVPKPWLPAGSRLVSMEGTGEVQTPLRVRSHEPGQEVELKMGDPALFRHAKAGELAERFNEYLLVSNGRIVSRAKTYRGLGHCFF